MKVRYEHCGNPCIAPSCHICSRAKRVIVAEENLENFKKLIEGMSDEQFTKLFERVVNDEYVNLKDFVDRAEKLLGDDNG